MLNLENVSLHYEKDKEILKNISMKVYEGECLLLAGESGAGKSSLINSINGLSYKYENAVLSGKIEVFGQDIKNMELYEIANFISSVFQNPKTHFFNVNTTLELLFYLENIGLDREEMDRRMDDMLNIFPISHLLNRNIFELSGGEKQILCVASCYISGCKIIVLDEPSSNLDIKHMDILREMFTILKNKGITLIIAEHRIFYLTDIVDRIMLMKDGVIYREFSRDSFLALSEDELRTFGLRSNRKVKLKNFKRLKGQDLVIKKIHCKFADKGYLNMENISFSLGNIYGITGKNGVGKSTFLRYMTGLEGKGEIIFLNESLGKKERLKKSALVMQDVNHQIFTDSVEREIELGADTSTEIKNDILSKLGIMELKDRHPMSLSGGQKQRVVIASVINKNANFIFLDEPTSGMDYNNMMRISGLIKEMKKSDNIIFVVSHDIEFLNETADDIINIERFRSYVNKA